MPNGLIGNLHGPPESKRHDSALLNESELLPKLINPSRDNNGDAFYVYEDPANLIRDQLQRPHKGAQLTLD